MSLYEALVANFYRWEMRGRGVDLYSDAVELEPPFTPFPGHRIRFPEFGHDPGGKTTVLSRLSDKLFRALQPPRQEALALPEQQPEDDAEPLPDWFGEKEPSVEVVLRLPAGVGFPAETMAHFLTTLSLIPGLVGFEIIGTKDEVAVQLVCQPDEATVLVPQLQAHFPEAELEWAQERLREIWEEDGASVRVVLDFGLHREFMWPLETGNRIDPFVSLIGGMEHLGEGEVAVYQVLFTPLRAPWAVNSLAAVFKENGKPFFENSADFVKQAQLKVARPLYGVVLRLAAKADSLRRTWEIVRGLAPALRLFSRKEGQSLMPLSNKDYPHEDHCDDLWMRRSRRCGMILNLDELTSLVHWPSPAVKSAKLNRVVEETTRSAPSDEEDGSIMLGVNDHGRVSSPVTLSSARRLQHCHVIGGSGTGKSTLLLSMMLQDLDQGNGFALLDPHGDLADAVLSQIPSWRMDEVVILDPSDEEFVTPFNVLSAHSDHEKTLLASDLVSVFRRLSTSWGDRMGVIFNNLVLAFLEHTEGGTLADMRRFLVDAGWRKSFMEGVDDHDVRFYWEQTFPLLDGPKSVGPILTRLETLLTPKIIRYMVSQRENRIDFSGIMQEGRILIVRLPMGQIGKENTFMLGSLVMVKMQQMAMGRARLPLKERRTFFCYVDECQHFVTPSMAEILTGARKYGLGMVLAHQDLHQLSQNADVAAAVMTNAATRIVFRVSESDGRTLKGDFAHFEAKDFSALPQGHAICRIERSDQDFNLRVILPEAVDEVDAAECRREAIDASRRLYTIPRKEVEEAMRQRMDGPLAKDKKLAKDDKAGKAAEAGSSRLERSVPEITSSPLEQPLEEENAPGEPEKLRPSEVSPEADDAEMASSVLPASDPPTLSKPPGMGRGGDGHKLIVERIAIEGRKLGFKPTKEDEVPGGRVDLSLTSRQRRIAVEVAVRSNTAHEMENLTKCLRAGFPVVVSVSPDPNVLDNIRVAAKKAFKADYKKLRFLSPEQLILWLTDLADEDAKEDSPPEENTRVAAGRKFRVRHSEASPEERRKLEAEQIEVIANLVNRNRSEGSSAGPE